MGKFIRHSNVDSVKVISVIQVESLVGEGIEGDPVRPIYEYFTTDGILLARTEKNQTYTIGHWKGGEDAQKS